MGGPCKVKGDNGVTDGPPCTDNFLIRAYVLNGAVWQSVEQFFQAYKYADAEMVRKFQETVPIEGTSAFEYGEQVKQMGQERHPSYRKNWEQIKVEVMYRAKRAQIAQHPDLQEELIATGDNVLSFQDGNPFWDEWNGKCITRIRNEIMPDGKHPQGDRKRDGDREALVVAYAKVIENEAFFADCRELVPYAVGSQLRRQRGCAMTDSQQHHKPSRVHLAGLQPQGATTETTDCPEMDRESPEQAKPTLRQIGGLVQEFEQAVGDFKQALSPRGACTPDRLATPSRRLDLSQTSPLCTDSWSRSPTPSPRVRVASPSPSSGREHVSLVTDAVLDTRIEQLTLAMHAHMVRVIREEITSFDSTLQGSFDALEARCAALEKKELERHEHDHCALAERIDELQRQSAEQNQRVAQRLEQLGHTGDQALDSLRLLGPRLDKMSQDHQESVEALDIELRRLDGMLQGPAPSVEADLQKIFGEMEDFKDQLYGVSQAQVNQFQKEHGLRVDDEMKLLKGKVDEVTDMGLYSKLCTDLENLQADHEAAPNVFDPPGPCIGAVIVGDPPTPEDATDDECRWECQNRALEIETAASKAHPEVTEAEQGARTPPRGEPPEHKEQSPKVICFNPPPLAGGSPTAPLESKRAVLFQHTLPAEMTGDSVPACWPQPDTFNLAGLLCKMDQKLDMSLRRVDEFVTRHEAKLQQLGEVGSQYPAVQQCVDDLRAEIGSVRGDVDVLRTDKVLKHMRGMPSIFKAGVPGGTEQ